MSELINSIYDRKLEVHYNEKTVYNKNGEQVKLDLKGKIKCPLLNEHISFIVCSHLMDRQEWPRGIDPDICKKCNCYVSVSIQRYQRGP